MGYQSHMIALAIFVAVVECVSAARTSSQDGSGDRNCTTQPDWICCTDECPPRYFRVNRSEEQQTAGMDLNMPSEENFTGRTCVTCAPCDHACLRCNGAGPENCVTCAEAYYADNTTAGSRICVALTSQKDATGRKIYTKLIFVVGGTSFFLIAVTGFVIVWNFKKNRKHAGGNCHHNYNAQPFTISQQLAMTEFSESGTTTLQPATLPPNRNNAQLTVHTESAPTNSSGQARPVVCQKGVPRQSVVQERNSDTIQVRGAVNNVRSRTEDTGKTVHEDEALKMGNITMTVPPSTTETEVEATNQSDADIKFSVNQSMSLPSSPVLSTKWQFSKEFSRTGGILQGQHSDVRLTLPAGAVEIGGKVKIRGAVCTNLNRAHKDLQLSAQEFIKSPVIEYSAGKHFRFNESVRIDLPHFLPTSFSPSLVRVYRFSQGTTAVPELEVLCLQSDGSFLCEEGCKQPTDFKIGVYYFGKDNWIHILTNHFSGYFCTYCEKDYRQPLLVLQLFAKHVETSDNKRLVDVRLEVWDTRLAIKDFQKDDSIKKRQMQLVDDQRMLPVLQSDVDVTTVALGTCLDFLSDEDEMKWNHQQRRSGDLVHPVEKKTPLKRLVPCDCSCQFPQICDWQLTNREEEAPDTFQCVVDVGYTVANQVPFKFMENPAKETFTVRVQKCAEASYTNNDATERKRPNLPNQPADGTNNAGQQATNPTPNSPTISIERSETVNMIWGSLDLSSEFCRFRAGGVSASSEASKSDGTSTATFTENDTESNFSTPVQAEEQAASLAVD